MQLEFECESGHRHEMFFKSFGASKLYFEQRNDRGIEAINCPDCGKVAPMVPSAPLGFALYGDPGGYCKPSPTKRHSTKLMNKDGNRGGKW